MYNQEGKLFWQGSLDSYGRMRMERGETGSCPFRYQGQYEDKEIGLYYNRFRYYSPEEGIYLSQDPIGLEGGSKLYGYVKDTTGWVDVFGLSSYNKASDLPTIKKRDSKGRITKEWKDAVESIKNSNGRGVNFRVENQKMARELLKESKSDLTKRRSYWRDEVRKKSRAEGKPKDVDQGFEYHLENETNPNAPFKSLFGNLF